LGLSQPSEWRLPLLYRHNFCVSVTFLCDRYKQCSKR
jgi:hypothetical protein